MHQTQISSYAARCLPLYSHIPVRIAFREGLLHTRKRTATQRVLPAFGPLPSLSRVDRSRVRSRWSPIEPAGSDRKQAGEASPLISKTLLPHLRAPPLLPSVDSSQRAHHARTGLVTRCETGDSWGSRGRRIAIGWPSSLKEERKTAIIGWCRAAPPPHRRHPQPGESVRFPGSLADAAAGRTKDADSADSVL